MATDQRVADERTSLTSSNKFELLLFRLGSVPDSDAHELYGINVFKIREISTMPSVTPIMGASEFVMGAVDIRGQIIPVIDLPRLMGRGAARTAQRDGDGIRALHAGVCG